MAAPLAISPNLIGPSTPASTADLAKSKVKDAANRFETQFLAQMIGHMFEGVSTDGPFGGGFGEEMFRSLMTEAMAGQVAKSGGVGVSATIQREMLKMQGLS